MPKKLTIKKPANRAVSASSKSTDLADILFPSADELTHQESILSIPPEQRRLHTETIDYSVSTIVESLENGTIRIPEFQRRYVWNNSQASRLIESLIIQCPIPVIYLSQRPDEMFDVIDGNQRLNSLRRFLDGSFKLIGLTAYPELEGNYFHDLDPRFQRHITNRTIRCLIILKDTHPQVKFDVFERLNSGSIKLNAQELRHGIYFGDATLLAEKLAKKAVFSEMVAITGNKRMKLEELVLRYWALAEGLEHYQKPLSGFLNSFCERNRELPAESKRQLERSFHNSCDVVAEMFGDLAFSIFDENDEIISKFNAALFDAQMVGAARLLKSTGWKPPGRRESKKRMLSLLEHDLFQKRISKATSDTSTLKGRVSQFVSAFKNA